MFKPKLIVGTHYLIWDLQGNPRFDHAITILDEFDNEVYIFSISFWELGMLIGKGKISQFFADLIRLREYKILHLTPVKSDVISQYANEINGDPDDRVISATALEHNATLLTADIDLRRFSFLKTV